MLIACNVICFHHEEHEGHKEKRQGSVCTLFSLWRIWMLQQYSSFSPLQLSRFDNLLCSALHSLHVLHGEESSPLNGIKNYIMNIARGFSSRLASTANRKFD